MDLDCFKSDMLQTVLSSVHKKDVYKHITTQTI